MHHLTSGFKSLYTQAAYEGIDTCRQACGGVGFSAYSLLPSMVHDYAPIPVFEGDNTVMSQQNSKYIIKKVTKALEGKPAKGFFSYFNNLDKLCDLQSSADSVDEFSTVEHLDIALAVRAAYWVRKVVKAVSESDAP